ncbi:uncharacterized protein LOC116845440 [Odontomachus brunneus]|uniref:uncharacterized protein LOC116845440 n=1 Tax=Odontomachus brunneus TaxID=486640 RepID=UPI0013F297D8|nr:uncharacterized protein LOC116845440 [Odontomachus brunneus]
MLNLLQFMEQSCEERRMTDVCWPANALAEIMYSNKRHRNINCSRHSTSFAWTVTTVVIRLQQVFRGQRIRKKDLISAHMGKKCGAEQTNPTGSFVLEPPSSVSIISVLSPSGLSGRAPAVRGPSIVSIVSIQYTSHLRVERSVRVLGEHFESEETAQRSKISR